MSDYQYTDAEGDKLRITTGYVNERIIITCGAQDGNQRGVFVSNSDIPAVAAELFKAAGLEAIIVLHAGDEAAKSVEEGAEAALSIAAELLRAAGYSELADRIDPKVTQEAEKKLQERRDALAKKFTEDVTGFSFAYTECDPATRNAIDYIIEDGK